MLAALAISAVSALLPLRAGAESRVAEPPSATILGAVAAQDAPAPADPGLEPWLAARRELAAQVAGGGWPAVGPGPVLRPGDLSERVAALRRRLAASGDLAQGFEAGPLFDAELEGALRRFQDRHGLAVDGKVGRATLAALDVPAADRLLQLDASLTRRKALPLPSAGRFVLVNLAAFRLEVVEDGRNALTMKVVVGKPATPSPELSSQITHLILYPFWNVPSSIARQELAPREARQPGYLAGLGIRAFAPGGGMELATDAIDWPAVARGERQLVLRQEPGPRNSLGILSLQLPNAENVCLHDTPEKRAFDQPQRALSHGCVRLEDATALAAHLLRDDPAGLRALAEAIAGGQRREIRLPAPIAIHMVYWTAWPGPDGRLQLRDDLYALDGLRRSGRRQR
jgi:murein L,D-transpeptidase YcbB/YkuD